MITFFSLFQEMTPNADQYHKDIQAAIDVYVQNANAYKVGNEKHIIIGDVYVAPIAQGTYRRARLEDYCPQRKTATMFFIDIGSVAYEVEARKLIRISREGTVSQFLLNSPFQIHNFGQNFHIPAFCFLKLPKFRFWPVNFEETEI